MKKLFKYFSLLIIVATFAACARSYSIGDYYCVGNDEGIVVRIDSEGQPTMLLSLFEVNDLDSDSALVWSSTLTDGWMLPDNGQMTEVRKNRSIINITLSQRSLPRVLYGNTYYWTSESAEKSHHYAMGPDGLKPYFHSNHSPLYRARAVKELK